MVLPGFLQGAPGICCFIQTDRTEGTPRAGSFCWLLSRAGILRPFWIKACPVWEALRGRLFHRSGAPTLLSLGLCLRNPHPHILCQLPFIRSNPGYFEAAETKEGNLQIGPFLDHSIVSYISNIWSAFSLRELSSAAACITFLIVVFNSSFSSVF